MNSMHSSALNGSPDRSVDSVHSSINGSEAAHTSDSEVSNPDVDINTLCHLISVGAREPAIGAHVTVWFLTIILSPPVLACQIIDVSGPQHFNSGCRDLSSYQQSMSRSAGTVLVENSKTTLSAPR
jgi:hypothetical protein